MQYFDPNHDYVNEFIDTWNRKARSTKLWMMVLGIVLVIAGVASAVAPLGMYAIIQTIAAVTLMAAGIGRIAGYVQTPPFFRNGAMLASGILNALLGILLFALPATFTAGTLAFLLAFLFIITGIERVSLARDMRYYQIASSSIGTATGVINIILGIAFILMPLAASITLSYLIAAYLVVGGVTLAIEAVSIKRIER